jgi:hypothetical protein
MEENIVEPAVEQVELVLQNSHRTWTVYEREAGNDTTIVEACFQPHNFLGAIPAFPSGWLCGCDTLRHPKLESHGGKFKQLFLKGNAFWTTSTSTCRLEPKQLSKQILAGVSRPLVINLQKDTCFDEWPGVRNQTCLAKGNYLAVLTVAWAYIFSARWLELSTHCSTGQSNRGITYRTYADSPKNANSLELDLGDASNKAARWWQALLAQGQGWSATVNFDGREYHSPWAVSMSNEQTFSLITHSTQTPGQDSAAPSFDTSVNFLVDFCNLHGIHDQCLAALSVVILLPMSGSTISLPQPKHYISKPANSIFSDSIAAQAARIPFYMALSGNSKGVVALLSGAFFNPAIDCNLVSPWLQPIFDILDPMVQARRLVHVLNILSIRQSRLAFLWLGAVIVGANRHVMQMARYGSPPISLDAAAWTRTSHSFIDTKPKPAERWRIGRKDDCRLLFSMNSEFREVPICPWKPFGYIQLEATEIEIRLHSRCGHTFEYIGWRWEGVSHLDRGYYPTRSSSYGGLIFEYISWAWNSLNKGYRYPTSWNTGDMRKFKLSSSVASRIATTSIFKWYRDDGWAKGEKNIYTHLWFDSEDMDEDLEAEVSEGEVCKDVLGIEQWRSQILQQ